MSMNKIIWFGILCLEAMVIDQEIKLGNWPFCYIDNRLGTPFKPPKNSQKLLENFPKKFLKTFSLCASHLKLIPP